MSVRAERVEALVACRKPFDKLRANGSPVSPVEARRIGDDLTAAHNA